MHNGRVFGGCGRPFAFALSLSSPAALLLGPAQDGGDSYSCAEVACLAEQKRAPNLLQQREAMPGGVGSWRNSVVLSSSGRRRRHRCRLRPRFVPSRLSPASRTDSTNKAPTTTTTHHMRNIYRPIQGV